MGYENAIQTKLLATNCCVCGRPLCDARSVEMGIGPECRDGATGDISEEKREVANKLIYKAAIAAQEGKVTLVREIAVALMSIGLEELGKTIAMRFVDAERKATIVLTEVDGMLQVQTPYRKDAEFVNDWRAIPGRRFVRHNRSNLVPLTEKRAVLALLRKWFPGKYATGCKGVFRIAPCQ